MMVCSVQVVASGVCVVERLLGDRDRDNHTRSTDVSMNGLKKRRALNIAKPAQTCMWLTREVRLAVCRHRRADSISMNASVV